MKSIAAAAAVAVVALVANQVAAAAQTGEGETGKFVIVPAGHTSLDNANLRANSPTIFSAWRLNTQTGDLQFYIYDSGA